MDIELNEKQQYWLGHVQKALSADVSMNAYAQQHHLDIKSLYSWKSQFVKKGILPAPTPSPFTKVKSIEPPTLMATPQQPYSVRLPNGVELKFETLTKDTLQLLSML